MVTTADGRPIELSRDTVGRRYQVAVDGEVIGEAEFLLTPDLVVFTHTEIDPAFKGQGVGSALIKWALDDVRAQGYSVLPTCPFVRDYIGRHEDAYADLLYRPPDEATEPRLR